MNQLLYYLKSFWQLAIALVFLSYYGIRYLIAEIPRTYYPWGKAVDYPCVIYVEARGSSGTSVGQYGDIVILNLQNGDKYYLNSDEMEDQSPILSEDGKTVYFLSSRTGTQLDRDAGFVPLSLYKLSLMNGEISALHKHYTDTTNLYIRIYYDLLPVPGDTAFLVDNMEGIISIYNIKNETYSPYFNLSVYDTLCVERKEGSVVESWFWFYGFGITPDGKYRYFSYSRRYNDTLRTIPVITYLNSDKNLLDFQDGSVDNLKFYGYNRDNGDFYLIYYIPASGNKAQSNTLYKYSTTTGEFTNKGDLNLQNKDWEVLCHEVINDSLLYGSFLKGVKEDMRPAEETIPFIEYNYLRRTYRVFDAKSKKRASYQRYWWPKQH